MILHAPLALLAALVVVTVGVIAPDHALEPANLGLSVSAEDLVTLASLSR